jgi:hypothetical protein
MVPNPSEEITMSTVFNNNTNTGELRLVFKDYSLVRIAGWYRVNVAECEDTIQGAYEFSPIYQETELDRTECPTIHGNIGNLMTALDEARLIRSTFQTIHSLSKGYSGEREIGILVDALRKVYEVEDVKVYEDFGSSDRLHIEICF